MYESTMGNRSYLMVTDPRELEQILADAAQQANISIDTETTSIDVPTFGPDSALYGISVAVTPTKAYYLPMGHAGPYQRFGNLDSHTVADFMTKLLALGIPVVYHNASYDRSVLHRHLGITPEQTENYHDTVLMAHLMDENQKLGLKPLAIKYLNVKPDISKLDSSFEDMLAQCFVSEKRKVPNKAGRLYSKTFYSMRENWQEDVLAYFIQHAGGAASYRYTLSLTQKIWNLFKKHGIEGYEQAPKPLDFQYVPAELANIYASDDVMNTLALFRIWENTFFDLNVELRELYENIERPVDNIMTKATIRGIPASLPYLENMQSELSSRIDTARKTAIDAASMLVPSGDDRFNFDTLLTSSKQLGTLLFDVIGYPVQGRTEKGAPQVNKDTLKKLKDKVPRLVAGGEAKAAKTLVEEKLKIADLEKIYGTYALGLADKVDGVGRIHPTYNVAGTVSGRMSSNNPNFQNMPRLLPEELTNRPWLSGIDIRETFQADPGQVFVDVDFTAMEMVMTAALSQDENLIALLKDGKDLHCHTARYAFKVGLELSDSDFKKQHKVERQKAKIVNFAMVYGGTEFTLEKNFGFTRTEAEQAVKGYFEGFPGVKKWMDEVYAHLNKHGSITYPQFGYIKRMDLPSPELEFHRPKDYQRQFRAALRTCQNALIQGWSAFIVKKAIVDIDKRLKDEGIDAWVCLQIHDEIGVMAKAEDAIRVRDIMMDCMQQTVNGVWLAADPEIKQTLSKSDEGVDEDMLGGIALEGEVNGIFTGVRF